MTTKEQSPSTEKVMRKVDIVARYELERNGCTASCWDTVLLSSDCDVSHIRNVRFEGRVRVGAVGYMRDARIIDCSIADAVCISNVHDRLQGLRIGKGAIVENVGEITVEAETTFGIGTAVAVLDETGSRPVYLYPQMSAQLATLMTLRPRWAENVLLPRLQERIESSPFKTDIEQGARINGSRLIRNVHIGREVTVEGASRLVNGVIINNAAPGKALAAIGCDVDAENFLIEDGYCGGGSLLRNVYIGQGASLDKGFTAHDSMFFANSAMENGEACAMLAGPYTVSMHKSSLLIGGRSQFMNAGSATNFSNHMYKLGPVHWGLMERGVKTASGAYVMWGARIGAFSLIMGNHKYHPDTSAFPFSYLFGDYAGHTTVTPGLMLRSCGLQRDEQKWPLRDRRLKRRLPLYDNICYEVLNPYTVQTMMRALPELRQLANTQPDADGMIEYNGFRIRPSAALKGYRLYSLAITRYLYEKTHQPEYTGADAALAPEEWVDLIGQVLPCDVMDRLFDADGEEMPSEILEKEFALFPARELSWVRKLAEGEWADAMKTAPRAIVELDALIDEDKRIYKEHLAAEIALCNG